MIRSCFILTRSDTPSYGVIGHRMRKAISGAGIDVKEIDYPTDENEVLKTEKLVAGSIVTHNTIGPLFMPFKGAFNIALPAHEWSVYPHEWAERLNRFDEVWVTSAYMKGLLAESGVTTPIYLLPPAVDIDPIPIKTNWEHSAPFRFLSIGEPHFRKGFHLLMEGFKKAFPEPGEAELFIKTSHSCDWVSSRSDITIKAEWLKKERLMALYQEFDCYVSASLGEGFDLPVAESALAALPIAANVFGAHSWLADKDDFLFKIDHVEIPQLFCSRPDYYADGQMCGYSSPKNIAETLRRAATSSDATRKSMAKRCGDLARSKFSSEICGKNIVQRIETISSEKRFTDR